MESRTESPNEGPVSSPDRTLHEEIGQEDTLPEQDSTDDDTDEENPLSCDSEPCATCGLIHCICKVEQCAAVTITGGFVCASMVAFGSSLYVLKSLLDGFHESCSIGLLKTVISGGGGVAGWFASHAVVEIIANAGAAYIPPPVTKTLLSSWSITVGAALSTGATDILFHVVPSISKNISSLFHRSNREPIQIPAEQLSNDDIPEPQTLGV